MSFGPVRTDFLVSKLLNKLKQYKDKNISKFKHKKYEILSIKDPYGYDLLSWCLYYRCI